MGLFLVVLLATSWGVSLRETASMAGMTIGRGFEEPATVIAFSILLFGALHLIELPFAFYQGYRLEHRFGLSRQTLRHWATDHVKASAIALSVATTGASIVYGLLRWNADWWWLWSATLFALMLVGVVQLAPVLLLPIFYTIKPLDRPDLVNRLVDLAARARTRVVGVYEWSLSAHTRKANAALTGLGRTRRILLSDTLLADYSEDEIEVVLAHELSHHRHHDLWTGLALHAILLTLAFWLAHLSLVAMNDPLMLRGIADPAGLPLLLVVGALCSIVLRPAVHALSRSQERRADRFALETTARPDAFISAMKRLSQQNLAEDTPSRVVQWLFYSHPPLRERIAAARSWGSQRE